MGHDELISACFFGKLTLKKHFFEVHTSKFLDPLPPPKFTLVEKFFYFFFWWLPLSDNPPSCHQPDPRKERKQSTSSSLATLSQLSAHMEMVKKQMEMSHRTELKCLPFPPIRTQHPNIQ